VIARMLSATTRSLASAQYDAGAYLPDAANSHESALLTAAAATLHYLSALPAADTPPALLASLQSLLGLMERHVRACTAVRRSYILRTEVRVTWCWALRLLVKRAPRMCAGLVAALIASDGHGLLPLVERGPLEAILRIMKEAEEEVGVATRTAGAHADEARTGE
jgi:hypothetical protein